VTFDLIKYTIGAKPNFTKSISNSRNLVSCETELISFEDEEGTIYDEWFLDATSTSQDVTLAIFLDNTDKE